MKKNKLIQFIGRLITAIIVLSITAFFTPGFTNSNIWIIISAILILTILDFLISNLVKLFAHPIIKGFIGFILCAITLYIIQYVIIGYSVSFVASLLGALVYAIVDYMLPSEEEKIVFQIS